MTLQTDIRKANYPKPDTNQYLAGEADCYFNGITEETISFLEKEHLLDKVQWKRFVEQFRIHSDGIDLGWKGEFWGKMMRGACFVYSYSHNQKLYNMLTETVVDMMASADETGRISTYKVDKEFTGWDVWCRKYVLLGMQYYLEICEESEFAEKVLLCMRRQADYIISKIGSEEEGKKPINKTAIFWRGLSASSLLEPMVRLYNLTKEDRYLKFAEYIVEEGGTSIVNIFKLAYEDKLQPYQYPVTKAYEMISCFEGLLEFYRVKRTSWHKEALVRFANRILEGDFTVIGSSGCSHELFDHSKMRQANTTNEKLMQETCVTVTLMKFFYQMVLLTGNSAYVDAFERSYYNAYLGAVNTEGNIGIDVEQVYGGVYKGAIPRVLPFDSYSPLTAGVRGLMIGGLQVMPDNHYYGCCACIGAAGVGLVPKMACMNARDGIVVNLYLSGVMETKAPSGQKLSIVVDTQYPVDGMIKIRTHVGKEEKFAVFLRIPEWSRRTKIWINNEKQDVVEGYVRLEREWSDGDEITLELDMRTKVHYPEAYGQDVLMNEMIWELDYVVPKYDEEDPEAKYHVALQRGPLMLAVDNRLGYDVESSFNIAILNDGYVKTEFPEEMLAPYKHIIELAVPLKDGTYFRVTDYASAGKLWSEESKMAVWIKMLERHNVVKEKE